MTQQDELVTIVQLMNRKISVLVVSPRHHQIYWVTNKKMVLKTNSKCKNKK